RDRPSRRVHSFPTRRSSDLFTGRDLPAASEAGQEVLRRATAQGRRESRREAAAFMGRAWGHILQGQRWVPEGQYWDIDPDAPQRSEEHTSELQSREKLVCRI